MVVGARGGDQEQVCDITPPPRQSSPRHQHEKLTQCHTQDTGHSHHNQTVDIKYVSSLLVDGVVKIDQCVFYGMEN